MACLALPFSRHGDILMAELLRVACETSSPAAVSTWAALASFQINGCQKPHKVFQAGHRAITLMATEFQKVWHPVPGIHLSMDLLQSRLSRYSRGM